MIQFKQELGASYRIRLEVEFANDIDSRVRAVLLDLNNFTELKFGKSLIITCLNRTEEENRRVGGSPFSAHLDKRAADLRSRIFTEKELDLMVDYLYNTWNKNDRMKGFLYVLVHGNGNSRHIHVNITYKYRTN